MLQKKRIFPKTFVRVCCGFSAPNAVEGFWESISNSPIHPFRVVSEHRFAGTVDQASRSTALERVAYFEIGAQEVVRFRFRIVQYFNLENENFINMYFNTQKITNYLLCTRTILKFNLLGKQITFKIHILIIVSRSNCKKKGRECSGERRCWPLFMGSNFTNSKTFPHYLDIFSSCSGVYGFLNREPCLRIKKNPFSIYI